MMISHSIQKCIIARAKRGRVVQNEHEKVNRRHDRPTDPATQKANAQLDAKMPKTGLKIIHLHFFKAPHLSSDRPILMQNWNFTIRRGSGLRFRSTIFDAHMRVRSSYLPFKSVIFDIKMEVRISSVRIKSTVSIYCFLSLFRAEILGGYFSLASPLRTMIRMR